MNISDLGEFELIDRLTKNMPLNTNLLIGVGDDCAVMNIGGENDLLATCDSQVEGVHFSLQTSAPEDIGRKALAVNISDIAAMGGEPKFAFISLLLPPQLPIALLDGVYDGLKAEAELFGVSIAGGNIAGTGNSDRLVIDITLLGTVARNRAVKRKGAHVGDPIFVTGWPGESAAGLYTFQHPDISYSLKALQQVRRAHCVPEPRVNVGMLLVELMTKGLVQDAAMIDISDGLSGDLHHLCTSSDKGARLYVDAFPLSPALQTIAQETGQDPLQWFLHGGEDYELLFTVHVADDTNLLAIFEQASQHFNIPITLIGEINDNANGVQLCYADGHCEPLVPASWDHLKPSSTTS